MTHTNPFAEQFISKHPIEAARGLEGINSSDLARFIGNLSSDLAVLLLTKLDRHKAAQCLEHMRIESAASLIQKIPGQFQQILMKLLDVKYRDDVFKLMPSEVSERLRRSLDYSELSIGAYLDHSTKTFTDDILIEDMVKYLRENPHTANQHLFIIDHDQYYKGVINIADLITAPAGNRISTLIKKDITPLPDEASVQNINKDEWQSIEYQAGC